MFGKDQFILLPFPCDPQFFQIFQYGIQRGYLVFYL